MQVYFPRPVIHKGPQLAPIGPLFLTEGLNKEPMKNGPYGPLQEEVIYFLVGFDAAFFALAGTRFAGAAGAAGFAAAWASFSVVR
jgi:hypothetical protein